MELKNRLQEYLKKTGDMEVLLYLFKLHTNFPEKKFTVSAQYIIGTSHVSNKRGNQHMNCALDRNFFKNITFFIKFLNALHLPESEGTLDAVHIFLIGKHFLNTSWEILKV